MARHHVSCVRRGRQPSKLECGMAASWYEFTAVGTRTDKESRNPSQKHLIFRVCPPHLYFYHRDIALDFKSNNPSGVALR
jgi:hypothetical protein